MGDKIKMKASSRNLSNFGYVNRLCVWSGCACIESVISLRAVG